MWCQPSQPCRTGGIVEAVATEVEVPEHPALAPVNTSASAGFPGVSATVARTLVPSGWGNVPLARISATAALSANSARNGRQRKPREVRCREVTLGLQLVRWATDRTGRHGVGRYATAQTTDLVRSRCTGPVTVRPGCLSSAAVGVHTTPAGNEKPFPGCA